MSESEFKPMPKVARLNRAMIITEKLDGTNASVHVSEDGFVRAASRTRWITRADDNYGFAEWVEFHSEELLALGPGAHFGEWWGSGIQRGYGLDEKRFSLFNVGRWKSPDNPTIDAALEPPACCHVAPVIGGGPLFDTLHCASVLNHLREHGSFAAPGFMRPEGIMVYHVASKTLFKRTIVGDDKGKDWELK